MSFNQHSKTWDSPERIERAAAIAASLGPAIGLASQHHVLEFGCGTGLVSFALETPVERLVMLDTSEGMLTALKEKIAHSGVTYMTPILADLTNPAVENPIENDFFDVIHTTLVLHHVKDIDQILEALISRLKDGGRLAIVELVADDGSFHAHYKDQEVHHGFDPEALGARLMAHGLKGVRHEIIYRGSRNHGEQSAAYGLFMIVGDK